MKRNSRLVAVAAALASLASAWQAAPPTAVNLKKFASSADVQALIAKAKAERKEGQATVVQPLLQFAPYVANVEYRPTAGAAAIHPKDAEMMYVIDGAGTLVTGGKMAGTAIDGGEAQKIAKGDFLVIPENTPHQVTAVEGVLVLMSVKMPRGAQQ